MNSNCLGKWPSCHFPWKQPDLLKNLRLFLTQPGFNCLKTAPKSLKDFGPRHSLVVLSPPIWKIFVKLGSSQEGVEIKDLKPPPSSFFSQESVPQTWTPLDHHHHSWPLGIDFGSRLRVYTFAFSFSVDFNICEPNKKWNHHLVYFTFCAGCFFCSRFAAWIYSQDYYIFWIGNPYKLVHFLVHFLRQKILIFNYPRLSLSSDSYLQTFICHWNPKCLVDHF